MVKLGEADSASPALIERRPASFSSMKSVATESSAGPVRSSFAVTFTSEPLRTMDGCNSTELTPAFSGAGTPRSETKTAVLASISTFSLTRLCQGSAWLSVMMWISRSRCASALRSAFIAVTIAGPIRELLNPGWSARSRLSPSGLLAIGSATSASGCSRARKMQKRSLSLRPSIIAAAASMLLSHTVPRSV